MRAVRQHAGFRQQDVADRAGVSQRWVSELELGRLDRVSLRVVEEVCRALDIAVRLDVRWRGGELDRLLDRDHAAIVERVVDVLRRHGWQVRLEYGFNHYGDRGSVDVLAWHAATRTLLIIEVKTRLTDLQELLASLARKLRIVPGLVAAEGWDARRSVHMLVVLGTSTNRRVVEQHQETFDVSFPDRTRRVHEWLASPTTPFRGLWFIAPSVVARRGRGTRRCRVPAAEDRDRAERTVMDRLRARERSAPAAPRGAVAGGSLGAPRSAPRSAPRR